MAGFPTTSTFSRSGFTETLRAAAAERDDLRLFELEDVVAALRE